MATTTGTLLSDHAYSPAGYTAATAARAAYEAGQPATATLDTTHPLLACVGDMVSDPDDSNRDQEEGSPIAARFTDVSNLVVQSNCTYFLALGDNVYQDGQLSNYLGAYDATFGRVIDKTLPTSGNHEYQTANAADYHTYFGLRAGVAGGARGYYAVNVANWRVYCLNSNTSLSAGSAQLLWLAADLAAHPDRPAIAAWHHPRWTDGASAVTDYDGVDALWQTLYAAGTVQIVLNGHDHNYQRWDLIRSQGPGLDPVAAADGITQFVVGCGGNNFFTLTPPRPGYGTDNLLGGPGDPGRSTFGHDRAFGVLFLRLGPTSWDWLFRSIDHADLDAGTRAIH